MGSDVQLKSLTPILVVDAIAPSLPFWRRLGFELGMTVPQAEPFAFAILACGSIEIMLQTRASAQEDTQAVTGGVRSSLLYLSVADLAPVLAACATAPVAVPRRTTFYGADEIYLHDPAGNIIGFAAPAAPPAAAPPG